LLEFLDVCRLSIFIPITKRNLILGLLNMFLLHIHLHKKGYKCYHPTTKRFLVSANVTFVENENYFPNPYLQGEPLFVEDEDLNWYLLDPSPLQCQCHIC
ncbi:hypothetical protein PanWU01x14_206250, partial [Parasponia andersonii]